MVDFSTRFRTPLTAGSPDVEEQSLPAVGHILYDGYVHLR